MDAKLYRRIRIINSWFIIVLMLGLFFCYYIPWFSIDQTHPVEDNLYFNYNMMKKSSDEKILGVSETVELLIISMWIILIFALFSQLGLSIYSSPDYDTIGLLFILSGSIITIISSFLAFIFNYMVINGIQDLSSAVYPSYVLPGLNYYYLPMISIIILMVLSVYYTLLVAPSCLNHLKKIEVEEDKEIWRKAAESQKQTLSLNPPDSKKLSKPRKDIKLPAGFQGNNLNDQVDQENSFFDNEKNDFKTDSKEHISNDFAKPSDYKQNKNNKSLIEEGKPFFDQDEEENERKEEDKKREFRSPVVDDETQKLKTDKITSDKNDYVEFTEEVDEEHEEENRDFEFEENNEDDLKIEKTKEKNEQEYPQQKQVSVFGDSVKENQNKNIDKNNEQSSEVLHCSDNVNVEKSDDFEKTFLSKFQKRLSERKKDTKSSEIPMEEKLVQNDSEDKQEKTIKNDAMESKSSFSKEKARAEIMKFLEESRGNAKIDSSENKENNDVNLKTDEESVIDKAQLEPPVENEDIVSEQTISDNESLNEKLEQDKIQEEENIQNEPGAETSAEVLTVRCPKCKNEFDVETSSDEDVVQIECPHCGESGVLKK